MKSVGGFQRGNNNRIKWVAFDVAEAAATKICERAEKEFFNRKKTTQHELEGCLHILSIKFELDKENSLTWKCRMIVQMRPNVSLVG